MYTLAEDIINTGFYKPVRVKEHCFRLCICPMIVSIISGIEHFTINAEQTFGLMSINKHGIEVFACCIIVKIGESHYLYRVSESSKREFSLRKYHCQNHFRNWTVHSVKFQVTIFALLFVKFVRNLRGLHNLSCFSSCIKRVTFHQYHCLWIEHKNKGVLTWRKNRSWEKKKCFGKHLTLIGPMYHGLTLMTWQKTSRISKHVFTFVF